MEIVPEMTQICKLAEFYCSPIIADILDHLCTDESAEKVSVLREAGGWKRVQSSRDENPGGSKRSRFLFSDSHNTVNSHWFTLGPWEATQVLPRSTSLDKRSCLA